MKPFDEILFTRCDRCSFHSITKNEDKIIENPKYLNLNGGFLYTKRQQNAHLLGQKENIIGEAEAFLYKHYGDLLKVRKRTREHVQSYLLRMWDNFHEAGGSTKKGYIDSIIIGIYLGVGYIKDPLKLIFAENEQSIGYDHLLSIDDQSKLFTTIKSNSNGFFAIQKELSLQAKVLVEDIFHNFQQNQKPLTVELLSDYLISNGHQIYRSYGSERLEKFFQVYFDSLHKEETTLKEQLSDAIYASIWGIEYKYDTLIQGEI